MASYWIPSVACYPPVKKKRILKELVEREHSMTSYLGEGVALPHARVDMKRPYALAIGRCPAGLA